VALVLARCLPGVPFRDIGTTQDHGTVALRLRRSAARVTAQIHALALGVVVVGVWFVHSATPYVVLGCTRGTQRGLPDPPFGEEGTTNSADCCEGG
jgi:hypothetical protein